MSAFAGDRPAPQAGPNVGSAVEWRGDHIEIVDQTALPDRVQKRALRSADEVVEAIRTLAVRGAPAIGICAAYGVALGLQRANAANFAEARSALDGVAGRLASARPTAVNLAWAVRRTAAAARAGSTAREMTGRALEEARAIHEEDRRACRRIADFGRIELAPVQRIMTHCNTGWLATGGMGTALGIVYAKAAAGEPVEVLAAETRPLLQGARLTAWELSAAGVPVTLFPDAAAGSALASALVDAVVVGCDRVARNGDTANKVGTYQLAVLAAANDVPFYVAGPLTSFDPDLADGSGIVIETRASDEVLSVRGTAVAPPVDVFNPAFDVTPARLITAFITDAGVLRRPFEASIAAALGDAGTRSPQ